MHSVQFLTVLASVLFNLGQLFVQPFKPCIQLLFPPCINVIFGAHQVFTLTVGEDVLGQEVSQWLALDFKQQFTHEVVLVLTSSTHHLLV